MTNNKPFVTDETGDGKIIHFHNGNAYVKLRDYEVLLEELERLKEVNCYRASD